MPEDLRIESLRLRDFRNFAQLDLRGLGALTVLEGPNAVGKTSVVEAVQLVTALESFRTSRADAFVRWGQPACQVDARFSGADRQLDLRLRVEGRARAYELNGKPKRRRDLRGLLPAIAFTPDDLQTAKGAPALRRDLLDTLGVQTSRNYDQVRADYAKLVKQKNHALRDGQPAPFLDSIDDVLVRVGVQMLALRLVLVGKVRPYFRAFYADMTGGAEAADIVYTPSWLKHEPPEAPYEFERARAADEFEAALGAARPREVRQQRAVVGPHADDVSFRIDGRDATEFASQGQQRSIVLAFKLAELAVVQETLGQKPVLLLDDVMSELDERRRAAFVSYIARDTQTFITTTTLGYFAPDLLAAADVIHLGG